MCFCVNALAGGSFGAPETYTEQYKKNYPSPAVLPVPDEASRTELEGYSPFFCFEYDQKVEDLYPDSEARSKSEKQQDKASFWQFMESNLELPISKIKVRPDALMALPIAAECAMRPCWTGDRRVCRNGSKRKDGRAAPSRHDREGPGANMRLTHGSAHAHRQRLVPDVSSTPAFALQNYTLARRYWKQFIKPELKELGLTADVYAWFLTPTALAVTGSTAEELHNVKAKSRCEVS